MIRKALVLALVVALGWLSSGFTASEARAESSLAQTIRGVQPRIVKIFGAGGLRGLESYQSGFVISPEGHILTVWSYVLDSSVITIVANDGRRFTAELIGADPELEVAVLKVDADDLPYFNLDESVELSAGQRVLTFSNLYGIATGDEPASVLHGYITAITDLQGRRSASEVRYKGKVYVVDAMTNNPGAAGGALTDQQGHIAGVLGKEIRNASNNVWLNYSIPIRELQTSVEDILSGRFRPRSRDENQNRPMEPVTLAQLGLILLPDVLPKTPPFVERVAPDSPAATAGLQPNDLVMFAERRLISSQKDLREELTFIDRDDPVRLTLLRGDELIEVTLNE
ncbi:S1C family serine protease [Blastopirellula sp. JC732]|uniref:S1C family serine protease n=1 Tax=Blastopirellula sediminis TaxID=2894196 RepID=A0A9X1SJC8_9BACT|nr:S1C family serine protease [Blastopirellula sediminis]MCC9604454.1 S1C family serine protease [Blastopirellula sediminis]MCC9632247.1 S1C family serine protease [Blastopirellula sediminis]